MYKQVIVIRKDLKLSKGKLAVQVAHASLEAYKRAGRDAQEGWDFDGNKKVVAKAENLKEMLALHMNAKSYKIPCALIRDAGKTEVEPGTVTALAVGPDTEESVDRITGALKML